MEPAERRALAAARLLKDPSFKEALEVIRQSKRDEIEATALSDSANREMCFLQIRGLTELLGQLEVWARQAEPRKGAHGG
jgi:hypothetical protein